MKTVILCFLCLFLGQVISEDLPPLENASDVEEETDIFSVFSEPIPCVIEGGILGCSNDCKSLRFCLNGTERLIDCLKQTGKPNCNSMKEESECTSAAVQCPEPPTPPFICPGVGYYPHALNCAKVYQCSATSVILKICNPGTVFDPLKRKCLSGVPCYTFSYGTDGLCKGKEGSFVAHPLNKRIYGYCDGPFPPIYECQVDHIFNTNKLTCEYECNSVGRFKNPDNPKCYFICTQNSSGVFQTKHECCTTGQEFDEDLSGCFTPITTTKKSE